MSSDSSEATSMSADTPATSIARESTRDSAPHLDDVVRGIAPSAAPESSDGAGKADGDDAGKHTANTPAVAAEKPVEDHIDGDQPETVVEDSADTMPSDKNEKDTPKDSQLESVVEDESAETIDLEIDEDYAARDLESMLWDEMSYPTLGKSLAARKADGRLRNRQALSYFVLVEDRIKALESRIADLELGELTKMEEDSDAIEPEADAASSDLKKSKDSDAIEPDADAASSDLKKSKAAKTKFDMQLCVGWFKFEEFARSLDSIHPPVHLPYVIDVLTESWGTLSPQSHPLARTHAGQRGKQSTTSDRLHPRVLSASDTKPNIERIRINSSLICEAFSKIIDSNDVFQGPKVGSIQLQPFKFLLAYNTEIRDHVKELAGRVERQSTEPGLTSDEKPENGSDSKKSTTDKSAETEDVAKEGLSMEVVVDDNDGDNEEALSHFQVLIDFMDKHLADELNAYESLRSRSAKTDTPKVSFPDLWKLFAPGDIIYEPVNEQALRLMAISGGRKHLRWKASSDPYFYPTAVNDDSVPQTTGTLPTFADDPVLSLILTCIYLDFDGSAVGPVIREFQISAFDEHKSITSLQVYPIEYADMLHEDGSPYSQSDSEPRRSVQLGIRDMLEIRGKKFAEFANKEKVAHRDYRGLSLLSPGRVQEQIDSEIVVDPAYYYETEASESGLKPNLGWKDINEGDQREIKESIKIVCYCGNDGCSQNREVDTKIYDDRKIDSERRRKLRDDFPELYRWKTGQMGLKDKHKSLFPRCVYAYVLKSREWMALNINRIKELPERSDSFDALVLPPEHRTLVLSLVKMHSVGTKPVDSLGINRADESDEIQEDLVRGKGKGLIMLLHGVPGVGKTSTAELVAHHTKRPLYALTCGDIGETPNEVQQYLDKSFRLAHRWGCVMLLDEADVFLQTRNRTDMRRNAVVSVFLRSLEYYSGILILTTNKVGLFDEAFKSRIHVSLYYQALNFDQSARIWKVNLDRMRDARNIEYNEKEAGRWIKNHWNELQRKKARHWNGRQIHNACQTAAALAAYKANENQTPKITSKELDAVAEASREFDAYLKKTHGLRDDYDRAKEAQERGDDAYLRSLAEVDEQDFYGPHDRRRSVAFPHREDPPRYDNRQRPREFENEPRTPMRSRGNEYPFEREDRSYDKRPTSSVFPDDDASTIFPSDDTSTIFPN